MADIYKINSAKGVNQVNKMNIGDTYKASDGSTWTKTGNGMVDVVKDGVKVQGITGDIGTGNEYALGSKGYYTRKGTSSPSANTYVQQLQQMLADKSQTATDQSQSIKDMYAANLEAQKQQLESDYNNTLSDLDAERAKLDAIYSEQRRMASGDAAVARKSWNEAANVYGLNSGTQGQAQLAMSNQLQSDLNTLRVAEAEKRAEVERQRTLLGQQYQSAIQKAQEDNNLQLAQALYQEAVRVDNSIIEASRYDSDRALNILNMLLGQSNTDRAFDYQTERDAVADSQWQAQFDAAMQQQEFENALNASKSASIVDASGLPPLAPGLTKFPTLSYERRDGTIRYNGAVYRSISEFYDAIERTDMTEAQAEDLRQQLIANGLIK